MVRRLPRRCTLVTLLQHANSALPRGNRKMLILILDIEWRTEEANSLSYRDIRNGKVKCAVRRACVCYCVWCIGFRVMEIVLSSSYRLRHLSKRRKNTVVIVVAAPSFGEHDVNISLFFQMEEDFDKRCVMGGRQRLPPLIRILHSLHSIAGVYSIRQWW